MNELVITEADIISKIKPKVNPNDITLDNIGTLTFANPIPADTVSFELGKGIKTLEVKLNGKTYAIPTDRIEKAIKKWGIVP